MGPAGRCPYKGLARFEAADADYFCGRERLVASLVARLAVERFVGVIGASGSGKSSRLRAGLLPALAAGALPGSERWPMVMIRPGNDPRTRTAAALAPLFDQPPEALAGVLADVRGNDQYLRATWHSDAAVVVVSNWVGEVCVGATAVALADASTLIELLVSALQETATKQIEAVVVAASTGPGSPAIERLLDRLRRRFRPKLAQIIAMRRPPTTRGQRAEQDS
jgi:hypothetical protein